MGIVSAIGGEPPKSFASTSSPVDLVRTAVWITTCHQALSVPGGVRDAQGLPLPGEFGGAKSASKYMTKTFASLRSSASEEADHVAIATMEKLLKLWMKTKHADALGVLRNQKISWGAVVLAGSPTEKKKVKGKEITQITGPIHPKKSPWLSGRERTTLSNILAETWSRPEELRKEWLALKPKDQHTRFNEFIKALKDHYENINRLSSSIHSKLGHRKKWIYSACKSAEVAPKSKKDKANPFNWTQAFFKTELQTMKLSVALIFAPSHYLPEDRFKAFDTLDGLFNKFDKAISGSDITLSGDPTEDLWKEWANRFVPDFSLKRTEVPSAETLGDVNPYDVLDGSDEDLP